MTQERAEGVREQSDRRQVQGGADERPDRSPGRSRRPRSPGCRRTATAAPRRARSRRRATTNTETTSTIALDHSTGSRLGTAVRLDRIMPVLYSLVMVSAPSTATASWASVTAMLNGSSGLPAVPSGGPPSSRARGVDERQADQDDQADGGDQEDRQGPGGRADRPELDPLAAQQVAEAQLVRPSAGWRGGGARWRRRCSSGVLSGGRGRGGVGAGPCGGTPRRGARPSGTRRTRTSGTCRRPRGSP